MFYIFLRVAIDAPRHPHGRNTGNSVHRLHRTVTFLAREPCLDVPLMGKVHKIGNIVHFDPRNRLTILPVCGELQNLRTFADTGYSLVTSHAFADAGDAGHRRLVRIDMTVLARNLVVRCMHRVTEFDWLNRAAIRKIFAMHPCADEQPYHYHHREQGWLLRGPKRIENRDGQMVPPFFSGKSLPVSNANYKFISRPDSFQSLRRGGDFGTFKCACNAL